jgi:hypothetical protein
MPDDTGKAAQAAMRLGGAIGGTQVAQGAVHMFKAG